MDSTRSFSFAVVLALALPVGASAAGRAAPPSSGFKDVPDSHWAGQAIRRAAKQGLMPPVSKNQFRPSAPVTRAELAAVLVRVIDYLESKGPVRISSSPAKPEVSPRELVVLARFKKTHPSYAALNRLITGGYLIPDSKGSVFLPTPRNINQPASAEEVAAGFAGVMIRITEKRTALEHPETLQEGDRPETRGPNEQPSVPRRGAF
jgi:hypothetical protein